MRRPLAFATVLAAVLALPSAALADPGISVSSARDGSTAKLPAKATHTLRLTAGATLEELTVSVVPWSRITVTGAESVERPSGGTGPQLAVGRATGRTCATRSTRPCPSRPRCRSRSLRARPRR